METKDPIVKSIELLQKMSLDHDEKIMDVINKAIDRILEIQNQLNTLTTIVETVISSLTELQDWKKSIEEIRLSDDDDTGGVH